MVTEQGFRDAYSIADPSNWAAIAGAFADWLQEQGRAADEFTIRKLVERIESGPLRTLRCRLPKLDPNRCQHIGQLGSDWVIYENEFNGATLRGYLGEASVMAKDGFYPVKLPKFHRCIMKCVKGSKFCTKHQEK